MSVRQSTALLTTENLQLKTAFAIRGTSGSPRHTWLTRYRCSLPGLEGFAGPRCTEPEVPRIGSRALRVCNPQLSTPLNVLQFPVSRHLRCNPTKTSFRGGPVGEQRAMGVSAGDL